MDLKYGNFSSLEAAFCALIKARLAQPLERTLVITPSGALGRYLSALLARNLGGVMNVYFNKLSAVSAAIDKEINPGAEPLLSSDALQDFVLKNILERKGKVNRSLVTSMKATLRDMADALVDAEVLRAHAEEGLFDNEADTAYILNLTDIYEAYYDELALVKGYRTYREFFNGVLKAVDSCKYLASFSEIIFYGFYEFTGLQLELFNKIKTRYKTTVFTPYEDIAACAYSKKFFETNFMGGAQNSSALPPVKTGFESLFNPSAAPAQPVRALKIFSAKTPKEELRLAAKEILRLTACGEYKFADIALTARSMNLYTRHLKGVFEEHHIPLNTVIPAPLLSTPLAVFCNNLLNISINNFYKQDVLSIITSPYFSRKNHWRALVETSCVERDYDHWADLITPKNKHYEPGFLSWLREINEDAAALYAQNTWEFLAGKAEAVLDKFTDISIFTEEESAVFTQFKAIIDDLKNFTPVREGASEGEFLDELAYALKNAALNKVYGAELGVSAGDVMTLRAQSFKVVFLLGMNEKLFPEVPTEDPLLKDRFRKILLGAQGFWINQKLARHDEEKMLFYFTLNLAREKVFCTYHQSADGVKPAVISLYILELARALGLVLAQDVRPEEDELLLTKSEMSALLSTLENPLQNYALSGIDAHEYQKTFDMCAAINGSGALTPYDGLVKGVTAKKAFSPTALQTLAACPMKYFFTRVLKVKEPDSMLNRGALNADDAGLLYHKTLEIFYKENKPLEDVLAEVFAEDAYKNYGIYPVVWQVIRAAARQTLSSFTEKDAENMNGFQPAFFELEAAGTYENINLYGHIDRLDTRPGQFRVIDYKKQQKGNKTLTEKDLFKTNLLQPMIYLILAAGLTETKNLQAESFNFLNIERGVFMQTLNAAYAREIKQKFDKYLQQLTALITRGVFYLREGDHCEFCSFGAVCRKGHAQTKLRARSAPEAKRLEEFRP